MRMRRALEEKEDVRKQWGDRMGDLHLANVSRDRGGGGAGEVRLQSLDQPVVRAAY